MDINLLLTDIVKGCLIPLLTILTTYLVKFIKAKMDELASKTDNDKVAKYSEMLSDTIVKCVIATNQTFVDSLKAQDKFDKEAQKQAFVLTYEAVVSILSEEAKVYLTSAYGDLDSYINHCIEAQVNLLKP